MKLDKRLISIMLSIVLFFSIFYSSSVVYYADDTCTLKYEFTGENKDSKGYAEGNISLSGKNGTYWIYWGDNEKALEGYKEICKMQIVNNSAEWTMAEQTAIPANAETLLAFNSTNEPTDKTVENAVAKYEIPLDKKLFSSDSAKKYSFMSASDIHIDLTYNTYKYAEEHWKNALNLADNRNVDFVVTSGDHINNDNSKSGIYYSEWRKYLEVLANSNYANPVYEAIGNHEIWQDVNQGTAEFIKATGLDGNKSSGEKAYFEKELFGDHYIFLSLEGGFYPDRTDEFTETQLNWLEDLLRKYSGDGKNIFIIEHSLYYKYGAGDRVDGEPYYDIPLSTDYAGNKRLKTILERYKDTIFISGHTHIALGEQLNYSDNNGTSGQMLHNSSVGGVREIVNGSLDRNYEVDESEVYVVDVYDEGIIFNGANTYYSEYDPNCCYLVNTSAEKYVPVTETDPTTEPTTTVGNATSYYLKGSFNNWTQENPFYETSVSGVYTTTLNLQAGTYTFKINKGDLWLGNNGTIQDTTTTTSNGGWVMESSAGDCTLKASGGYYQFDFYTDTNKLKIFYIKNKSGVVSLGAPMEAKIGDIDGNGKVSISDATRIQLYLCQRLELSESSKVAADVNIDGDINVEDVTLIQKLCAKFFESFEKRNYENAVNLAEDNLKLYYRYSSYDSYQALKKAVKTAKTSQNYSMAGEINTLASELLEIVDVENIDPDTKTYTVYFENKNNWSKVNAYCWGDNQKAQWPGEACTYVETNNEGNKIYKFTVDTEKYRYIIFNNGSDNQTVDIYLSDNEVCYTLSGSSTPYSVKMNKR